MDCKHDGLSHCSDCCREQTSKAYMLIGKQGEQIKQLRETLQSLLAAAEYAISEDRTGDWMPLGVYADLTAAIDAARRANAH